MPYRPRKPCHHPGCPNLTAGMYCAEHQPQHKPDTQRPSAHRRGYTKRWQTASKSFLLHHPFCVRCRQQGRLTPATVVDHIIPHRGDQKLFWDEPQDLDGSPLRLLRLRLPALTRAGGDSTSLLPNPRRPATPLV